jgi:hypothetical protein
LGLHLEYIEKLSRTENDREINILLIKMTTVYLRASYAARSKKDDKKREQNIFEDEIVINYQNELVTANSIIGNILSRYTGDSLFVLIACDILSLNLFDNEELHRLFVKVLFMSVDMIHKLVFYNEEVTESQPLYTLSQFRLRHKYVFQGCTEWSYPYIFKGLDQVICEDTRRKDLSEKEYAFIVYILKNTEMGQGYTEIWKNNFKCAKFVIADLAYPEKVERSIWILEKYFLSDSHRQILEENYENLQNLFKYLYSNECETLEYVNTAVKGWIESPKSSTILRDGLRKLSENLKPISLA